MVFFIFYFPVFIFILFFGLLDSNCSFGVQDVQVEDNDVYPLLENQLVLLIHCFCSCENEFFFLLYIYFQLVFFFCRKLLLKIKLIWHLSIPLLLLMKVHELLFVVGIMALESKLFIIVNIASWLKAFTMMMLFKRRLQCKLKIQVNPLLMLMITSLIKCLISNFLRTNNN